jgi:hypothetical protein
MQSNTQTAGILLLVAAGAIVVGIVTKGFVSVSVRDSKITGHIGLLGGEVCGMGGGYGGDSYGGDCQSVPVWDNADTDVEIARLAAMIGGFAAAGCAAIAGLLAFQRKQLPPMLLHGAVGVATSGAVYLLIKLITDSDIPGVENSPSYSGFVLIGGLIMASVVAKSMLGGVPITSGAPAPTPYAAATAPCTRCGRPAQFVTQYQRWYCPSCQQYL